MSDDTFYPAKSGPNVPLVIVCGCVIALLSFGPRSAMGFFFQPMTEAHDWSREIFALAIAIQNLIWGAAQPVAGMMADRALGAPVGPVPRGSALRRECCSSTLVVL